MGISEQQYRAHMERRRLRQCAPAFGSVAAPVVTDDPYERGAKLTVLRSLRDDPLAAMHNARQIDQAQFVAGRHWQRAFELAEVGGVRAVDPTRERVDDSRIAQATISDAQIRAFADLKRAMAALGLEGESLIKDFLGRGWCLRDIAAVAARIQNASAVMSAGACANASTRWRWSSVMRGGVRARPASPEKHMWRPFCPAFPGPE